MQKHPQSAQHLQVGYNVRFILDNGSKAQNEADLIKTLSLEQITLEEGVAGFGFLDAWKSEKKIKDDYRAKAASRWSEATIFKN